jgi:hypothetical protein
MYLSSPNYKVPSPRYAQFITVFEKEVTAAQERSKNIEAMEYPYNIVKEAVEKHNLPNDSDIILHETGINITIMAVPSDSIKTFNSLITTIGECLLKSNIHKDGLPSCVNGGNWYSMFRKWSGKNPKNSNKCCSIELTIHLPIEGLIDIEVKKESFSYAQITYKYTLVPRDIPVTKEIKGLEKKYYV